MYREGTAVSASALWAEGRAQGPGPRSRAQGTDSCAFPFVTNEVIWCFRSPYALALGSLRIRSCSREIALCNVPSIYTTKPLRLLHSYEPPVLEIGWMSWHGSGCVVNWNWLVSHQFALCNSQGGPELLSLNFVKKSDHMRDKRLEEPCKRCHFCVLASGSGS
jgi:hypothetical protein